MNGYDLYQKRVISKVNKDTIHRANNLLCIILCEMSNFEMSSEDGDFEECASAKEKIIEVIQEIKELTGVGITFEELFSKADA